MTYNYEVRLHAVTALDTVESLCNCAAVYTIFYSIILKCTDTIANVKTPEIEPSAAMKILKTAIMLALWIAQYVSILPVVEGSALGGHLTEKGDLLLFGDIVGRVRREKTDPEHGEGQIKAGRFWGWG